MYFPDLSPYHYMNSTVDSSLVTVGWLDADHSFQKGSVSRHLLDKILRLCFSPVNQTRGYHQSPFLNPAPVGYAVEYDGKRILLGDAEIRVSGSGGKTYAAPNLIYHYIKDCGYLPPKEFLDALEVFNGERLTQ
jgi:hypothetical protein